LKNGGRFHNPNHQTITANIITATINETNGFNDQNNDGDTGQVDPMAQEHSFARGDQTSLFSFC
jgi:hypothetical protein